MLSLDNPYYKKIYDERLIDSSEYITKLQEFGVPYVDSYFIEDGIYQFSLSYIYNEKINIKFIKNIYIAKFNEICYNLNETNNTSLLKLILNCDINPFSIAFLSPDKLNPEKWKFELNKQTYRNKIKNNITTTDRYLCKCGARKAVVTLLQMRCADEAISTIIQCIICKRTIIS